MTEFEIGVEDLLFETLGLWLLVSQLQKLHHQDTKGTKFHKENRTLTLCFWVPLVSWW